MIGVAFELLEMFVRGAIILTVLFLRAVLYAAKMLLVLVAGAMALAVSIYEQRQSARATNRPS